MKVFIADDSILIRNIVRELLATDPNITIVGEASNGADAVSRSLKLNPDIVIMDIDMPIMNGLEATERISAQSSIPVLVFTHNSDPGLPFRALEKGAVDFLLKPDFNDLNKPDYVKRFIERLRILSTKKLLEKAHEKKEEALTPAGETAPSAFFPLPRILVIGASTGGPQALASILSAIKAPYPLPIVIVQHIETGFDKGFADWLGAETKHKCILAQTGLTPESGTVYIAPTDLHLILGAQGFLLEDSPKVLNQKPSIDLLFGSAAGRYGAASLAVLLTGMGSDGAEGCLAITLVGGMTVVQDQASSLIFGMPRSAIAKGAASLILPLSRIGPFLSKLVEAKR